MIIYLCEYCIGDIAIIGNINLFFFDITIYQNLKNELKTSIKIDER